MQRTGLSRIMRNPRHPPLIWKIDIFLRTVFFSCRKAHHHHHYNPIFVKSWCTVLLLLHYRSMYKNDIVRHLFFIILLQQSSKLFLPSSYLVTSSLSLLSLDPRMLSSYLKKEFHKRKSLMFYEWSTAKWPSSHE